MAGFFPRRALRQPIVGSALLVAVVLLTVTLAPTSAGHLAARPTSEPGSTGGGPMARADSGLTISLTANPAQLETGGTLMFNGQVTPPNGSPFNLTWAGLP